MRGDGGGRGVAGSQPMNIAVLSVHMIQINFGDLHVTPYLKYSSVRGGGSVSRGDGKCKGM
jgi:hypothetical protein